ncbi:hypothetical protein F511_38458 [Dorcoceras hygrometricum]|uniref:Splicing factor 3B subunit 1-like n=1 Tax=Dorcoceras hygrometricum TaxID=472368 RepID=A0A2Z7B604_9LAMI|nr:hypothetical protein F511_38458 [Dorcoceras hygrometricum]
MKIEFRLMNDILAKTVRAKDGSFDAVTHERFLLMAAIHGVQLCYILEGVQGLTLGESKDFPPLKILTVKIVGTYIAKNKSVSTAAEKVMEEPMVQKVVTVETKRRPAPATEPVSKKKRTTVGRAAPTMKDLPIVPVQETDEEETDEEEIDKEEKDEEETDNEKKDEEATDSKYMVPLSKVLNFTETSLFDEESLSFDEILKQIPEDMMLPSISAEEPTPIKFGRIIAFKEVDWYKGTIPKIDPAAKGKEPLVEEIKGNPVKEIISLISTDEDFLVQIIDTVLEEISTFFQYS